MSSAAPPEPAASSRSPCVQPNQIASWAEHLPPKLASERVQLPGSFAFHAKSSRAVRSKLQLLSQAFFDDTPEVSVERHSLPAGWLTRIQTVFRNALALRQAAHLSNLKAFDKKIPDPSLDLRTINTQELLSADRKLWAAKWQNQMLRQQWSLDDALYDLTHMRNDARSLLQLRPKISKPTVPAPPRPATPRQRQPKRDPKPARKPSHPTKKGKEKSEGARYQCTNNQCRFADAKAPSYGPQPHVKQP